MIGNLSGILFQFCEVVQVLPPAIELYLEISRLVIIWLIGKFEVIRYDTMVGIGITELLAVMRTRRFSKKLHVESLPGMVGISLIIFHKCISIIYSYVSMFLKYDQFSKEEI